VSDAREQLLTTIEDAVAATLDRHLPGLVEDLAERVAERLAEDPPPSPEPELVDAEQVARRFGVSRDYVYEHAGDLGAVRLGDGPRARLRFDLATVAERLSAPPLRVEAPHARPRRQGRAVDLLPVARRPSP